MGGVSWRVLKNTNGNNNETKKTKASKQEQLSCFVQETLAVKRQEGVGTQTSSGVLSPSSQPHPGSPDLGTLAQKGTLALIPSRTGSQRR